MIKSINSKNFEQEILKSSTSSIVDFYSPSCGVCKQMEPIFEELSKELTKYQFVSINIEEDRELAVKNNVSSIPAFIFFKNGKDVGRLQGYINKQEFKNKIESILA